VLDRLADREEEAADYLSPETYKDLADTCSAFRTSLTEDLETRRQRSLWWVVARWRLHRRQHALWDARRERAGGRGAQARAYPLAEMPLPHTDKSL